MGFSSKWTLTNKWVVSSFKRLHKSSKTLCSMTWKTKIPCMWMLRSSNSWETPAKSKRFERPEQVPSITFSSVPVFSYISACCLFSSVAVLNELLCINVSIILSKVHKNFEITCPTLCSATQCATREHCLWWVLMYSDARSMLLLQYLDKISQNSSNLHEPFQISEISNPIQIKFPARYKHKPIAEPRKTPPPQHLVKWMWPPPLISVIQSVSLAIACLLTDCRSAVNSLYFTGLHWHSTELRL